MKPFIKILIAVLVCVSIILIGCAKKDYSQYREQSFDSDILAVKSLEIEKQSTFIEFKDELLEFKSFSDEFFPVWSDYIDRTAPVLDEFNSSTVFEEKTRCSKELEQSYMEFKVRLKNIKPPAIAKKAYDLAVENISCRELFFKKYNENAPVKELDEIESRAYLAETGFWEEIDNVYRYFDEEISRIGLDGNDKYIAFN